MKNTNQNYPKWLCCAGAFFFCFFVQCCLCAMVPLRQTVPVLAPLAVAAMGFLEGSGEGAVFGLGAGVVCAASFGSGNARAIWLLALTGYLCGLTVHRSLGRTFPGYLLCALGTLALWEGTQAALALTIQNDAGTALLSLAAREAGYSMLFAPVIYLIYSAIHRRFRPGLEFETP